MNKWIGIFVHIMGLLLALLIYTNGDSLTPLPLPPIIYDQVEMIHDFDYLHPVILPLKTTEDGRIGINAKIGARGHNFFLNVPEKLQKSILISNSGPQDILASSNPVILSTLSFESADPEGLSIHTTICDPTNQNLNSTIQRPNPFACGNNKRDCYDLELLTLFAPKVGPSEEKRIEFWQTPIRVVISNPKTVNASIQRIRLRGQPQLATIYRGFDRAFEPIVVGEDKNLLIMRISGAPVSWPNKDGKITKGNYNVVYSYGGDNNIPCNARGFSQLYPISYAPADPRINKKYGFAMHPFRDTKGAFIPAGEEIGLTYPWMDKKANNLVMMGSSKRLFYWDTRNKQSVARYNVRCVDNDLSNESPNDCHKMYPAMPRSRDEMERVERQDAANRYYTIGLWTNGKLVQMDTPISGIDFSLRIADQYHREAKLYRSGPNDGHVRMGSGRDNSGMLSRMRKYHTANSSLFESVENIWNHLPNLRPRMPKDVVWLISSSQRTFEFSFDDYISSRFLIFSPMNAAVEYEKGKNVVVHKDGWNDSILKFDQPIELQNAATSNLWNIPTHGYIFGGTNPGRIEPITMGGVMGKGFFTSYNQGISYDISNDQGGRSLSNRPWYIGMFLDPRMPNDKSRRRLIDFPGGKSIKLEGLSSLVFQTTDGHETSVDISGLLNRHQWSHLGFQLVPNGLAVRIYINGFRRSTYRVPKNSSDKFQLQPGRLTFSRGVRGWLDEIKVIEGQFTYEEYCNHAQGTLRALASTYPSGGVLLTKALKYPDWSHNLIEKHLTNVQFAHVYPKQKYVCETNYLSFIPVDIHSSPEKTISIRNVILYPEGPLRHNASRPDSRKNSFCLTCHISGGTKGLNVEKALGPQLGIHAVEDARRQPLQCQPKMYGRIPAGYSDFSNSTIVSDRKEGTFLDPFVLKGVGE